MASRRLPRLERRLGLRASAGNAFGFLTILPLGEQHSAPSWQTLVAFPLVGACLGLLAAVLDHLLLSALPSLVRSALVLALLAILSGGLHLDGLIDSFDGLFGGGTPSERLAIMRDSRLGSYGAVAAIVVVLVQLTCLAEIHPARRVGGILAAAVLGRWAMVYALAAFPYGRQEGMGAAFKAAADWRALAAATAVSAVIVFTALGPPGLALLGLTWLAARLMGGYALRRVPGLTGDVYGALNEMVFMLTVLTVVALQGWAGPVGR